MDNLLEHLGKETLPRPLLVAFVQWCVLEQARPALAKVLRQTQMGAMADSVAAADGFDELAHLSEQARRESQAMRGKSGPLAISAAEAAAFEFMNLMEAASDTELDAEGVAFFSARVSGWAGWAEFGFTDTAQKANAEHAAAQEQEACLRALWEDYQASLG
jgi:hypothetical protein